MSPTHEQAKKDARKAATQTQCAMCDDPVMISIGLPAGKVDDKGAFVPEKNVSFPVGVCQYHFFLSQSGLFGVFEENGTKRLHGPPATTLYIIESVCTAMLNDREWKKKVEQIDNHHLRSLGKCPTCEGGVTHGPGQEDCEGCRHLRTCAPFKATKPAPTEDEVVDA